MDFKEDPSVDFDYLEQEIKNKNFEILLVTVIKKAEPQQFNNFVGSTYKGYCIKKCE